MLDRLLNVRFQHLKRHRKAQSVENMNSPYFYQTLCRFVSCAIRCALFLAEYAAHQRKTNEAIEHSNIALQIDPIYANAHFNLAFMYAMRNDYDRALPRFKEVLDHWPDKAETHYNIACMYSRSNKKEESIEWLQKAIDKGYSILESMKSDSDLENIRDTNAYKELVKGH